MAKQKPTPEPELTTAQLLVQKQAQFGEIMERAMKARFNPDVSDEDKQALESETMRVKSEMEELASIAVAEEVIGMIEGKVKFVKPLMPKIGGLIKFLKPEIATVFKTFITLLMDVGGDLDPEIAKFSKIRAKAIKRSFEDLVEAGFTTEQAMQIIIAQISRPVSMPAMHFPSFPGNK